MLYRKVPKNGDKLSVLGFGAMRLPVKGNNQMSGKIDEGTAGRQLYYCIDKGINYVDTAYPYHSGNSESFLGRALSENGYRDKVKIATKLPYWMTANIAEMNNILDEQLNKLQTDRIDYYLIHALSGDSWELCKKRGIINFLERALRNGKIINAGFSFHGAAKDFNKIVDDYNWIFCQIQYNFLDQQNQAGTAGLKYAASKKLAVMVMEPLRGGNLAKTPPREVQKIWEKSMYQWSPAERSFRWILNNPEVTSVLSGMNLDEHIDENLRIAEEALPGKISKEELKLVDEAADTYLHLMKAGCTGCQYCMPCPAGVNIPGCFEFYNSLHMFKDKGAKIGYLLNCSGASTGKPALASQCINCGKCLKHCPQHLKISGLLEDVKNEFEGIKFKIMLWLFKKIFKVKKANEN